jgi:hypothetical protein
MTDGAILSCNLRVLSARGIDRRRHTAMPPSDSETLAEEAETEAEAEAEDRAAAVAMAVAEVAELEAVVAVA